MTKLKIENIVKPSIKGIAKYIPGESPDKNTSKFIKLSSNESPFAIPAKNFSSINKNYKKFTSVPRRRLFTIKNLLQRDLN